MAGGVIGKAGKEVWFHPGDGQVEEGSGGELHGGGEESLSAKEGEESKVRGDKEEGDEIELETVCWMVMVVGVHVGLRGKTEGWSFL